MACRPASDRLFGTGPTCWPVTQKTATVHILFNPRNETVTYGFTWTKGEAVFESAPVTVDISNDPGCNGVSPCPDVLDQCVVRETLTNLSPGSSYEVLGICYDGGVPSILGTDTPQPVITTFPQQSCTTLPIFGVSDTEAVLGGTVTVGAVEGAGLYANFGRPDANRVRYKFQWGTTASYGNTSELYGPVLATSASEARQVLLQISDLEPGTLYHYRIVTQTDEITVNGADQTFLTDLTPKPIGVM